MKENELELEIVCNSCGQRFKRFDELLVWHIPKQILTDLKLKQKPHLKCPYCRGNQFTIAVLKDAYGEYGESQKTNDVKEDKIDESK
jgi:uncharacterized Zn-finger protein